MSEEIVIGDVRPRIQAVGDGQQTQFIYPFAIFKEADLDVYLDETLQAGNYSVQGAGESTGGYVVFSQAPAAGVIVTMRRRLDIHRTSDFAEGGAFHARVINRELDYLVAVTQQNADDINSRAVLLHPADQDATLVLPSKEDRRNRALTFDETGSPIPGPDVSKILIAQESADVTILAAQQAQEAQVAAEAAAATATSVDLGQFRKNTDQIHTADIADGAITQTKIDPSVQLGGLSLGTHSIIRTNATTIVEDITVPTGLNGMSAGPITIGRSNMLLWSEDLTNPAWPDVVAQSIVGNVTALNPFGVSQQISEVTFTNTSPLFRQPVSHFEEGKQYTFSGYFKLVSGSLNTITVDIYDYDTTVIGTPTNEWTYLTGTVVAGPTNVFFDVQMVGSVGSVVQVFGLQLVEGSAAVSYVKTTASQAEATVTVNGTWTVVGS